MDAEAAYSVVAEGQGRCALGDWLVPEACVLPLPFSVTVELGQWERQSEPLSASPDAQRAFEGAWAGGLMGGLERRPVLGPPRGRACKDARSIYRQFSPTHHLPTARPPAAFLPYLEREAAALGDDTLEQEVALLTNLTRLP